MDKLEPILKQKFWILAFLVLPMAMYGYYSANGVIKAETTAREGTLDTAKNGVPGGSDISQEYADKLSAINDQLEKQVDAEIAKLWENQQPRMTWPALIAPRVPKTFLGDIDAEPRRLYKSTEYERVIQKLVESVEPVVTKAEQELYKDKPQKVWLSGWVPETYLGPPQTAPASADMWSAQIDVWLTQLLFDAVKKMNEGKDSITESIVRRVDKVELLGGDGQPVVGSAGGAGMTMSDGMSMEMPMADTYSNTMSMGEFGGGVGNQKVNVAFNPAEEFGAGGGASEGAPGGGFMSMSPDDSGGGFAAEPAAALRYIAEAEDAPFLERGFYMTVVMMEKKIPDFIVELANSPWPIRVIRFHVGPNPYAQKSPTGTLGSPLLGPMAGGPGGALDYNTESYEIPSGPGYGASEMPSDMGMGGFGGGAGRVNKFTDKLKKKYTTALPEFTQAAMNHPDLVIVHLCGIITIYKQPQVEVDETAGESGAAVDAALPVLPEGEMPVDGVPAEGTPPATEGNPETPVESAVPAESAVPSANMPADSAATQPTESQPSTEPASAEGSPAENTPNPGTPTNQ